MLRDILRGNDPQIDAVSALLRRADADILALQGFDYDLENAALKAFADHLKTLGVTYPYIYAAPPNAGRRSALDLDGDSKPGTPRDAQGYGRFFGDGAMAILSRYPVDLPAVQDFTALLWRDMPGAIMPKTIDGPFPSLKAHLVQRLPSHGAWVVPIQHPDWGRVTLLTYHATPPVFDGPEDRNGRRNHDETQFWSLYLGGQFGTAVQDQFIILGDANLDPDRGDGIRSAIQNLLAHPKIQDPLPGIPTVTFSQTGPLRTDYVLPSNDWTVIDTGVLPADPNASRHSLVWVDLKP